MATLAVGHGRRSAERLFYTGIAVAMFATVFLGFARSFFLRPWFPDIPAPTEPIFFVHGVAFTAWLVLLVVQPALVAAHRTDLHRKVGWLGAGLAVAMVALGVYGALVAARRPTGFVEVPVPPLQFLAVPLFDMALFATLVGLAVAKRRDTQSHKRLMLLASVNLLAAGIARWPFAMMQAGPPCTSACPTCSSWPWSPGTSRRAGASTRSRSGAASRSSSRSRFGSCCGHRAWLAFAGWAVGLLG